jgi:microcystin degradation protein MlrC
MNILVAGFQHEPNAFAPTMATYDSFVRGMETPQRRTPDGIQRQT